MPYRVLRTVRPPTDDWSTSAVPAQDITSNKSLSRRRLSRRRLSRREASAQYLKRGLTQLRQSHLGQTTAEYALVLLGAATVALLLTAWAGQTNRIGSLFDAVLRSVTNLIN